MAEEEKVSETNVDESTPEKKGSMMKFVIIGMVLIVLGGGSAAWFIMRSNNSEEGVERNIETTLTPGVVHELDPFIVNLLGHQGKRYLKAKIEVEVDDDEAARAITDQNAQLRDSILLLLANKSMEEVLSLEGKTELRNELITRINQVLEDVTIRTLYFTEFVVQ